jgi:hypothetical protein
MVNIPAEWVPMGYGVPDVCAWHGLPAVRRQRVRLISRPPLWALPFLLGGVLLYLVIAYSVRKTATAPAWPFCAQCVGRRQRLRLAALILSGVTVLSFVAGLALAAQNNMGALFALLVTLVAFVAALVVSGRSKWVVAGRAQVSGDGRWVQVKACAEFERAALSIQQAAAGAAAGPPPVGYPAGWGDGR